VYTRLFKSASLLAVSMILSANALAAGADRPKEETAPPAETGLSQPHSYPLKA